MRNEIDIIPAQRIDTEKWEACLSRHGGLIYSRSSYLNTMADNWHGIILNDYECVMALPWRKKAGLRYCYDVPFVQQLGYYGKMGTDLSKLMTAFYSFVKYGHYNFNFANQPAALLPGATKKTNLILALDDKESVQNNFTKSFTQSLQRAAAHNMHYGPASIEEAIGNYRGLHDKIKGVKDSDLQNLLTVCRELHPKGNCIVRRVSGGDAAWSVALLLKHENRLYNLINATSAEGRKKETNYLLYANLFDEFAAQGLVFDLEGSELEGVKSFYLKMGATEQSFPRLHFNKLPFPMSLYKGR